jgi:hypothetical protein
MMMLNKRLNLLALLLLGLNAFFMFGRYVIAKSSPGGETRQKWEYCRLLGSYRTEDNHYKAQVIFPSTPDGHIDEIESGFHSLAALNKLGSEGWEVVDVIGVQSAPEEYLLRRPKP